MRSWLNKAGRGPTKLISPVKTLQNCGSSSWLDFRSNLPTQASNGGYYPLPLSRNYHDHRTTCLIKSANKIIFLLSDG